MNQYYLMAQLPSLDGVTDTSPLPITQERFLELCERFLGKRAKKALENMTLSPDRVYSPAGAALLDAWNDGERRLRLALGAVRAERMHKSFDTGAEILPEALMQIARSATEMKDPMAAEQYLNRHRLAFLETLRPADMFSEASVFYYGLRLMLLGRTRRFDGNRGRDAYKTIYHSILHGEKEEALK